MSTEGEDKLERVVAIRGAHPGVSTKVIFVGTAISGTHIVVVFLALSLLVQIRIGYPNVQM